MRCDKRKLLILMAEQSFTRETLAEKTGLAIQTIWRLLNGYPGKGSTIKKVADALNVRIIDIVADDF